MVALEMFTQIMVCFSIICSSDGGYFQQMQVLLVRKADVADSGQTSPRFQMARQLGEHMNIG